MGDASDVLSGGLAPLTGLQINGEGAVGPRPKEHFARLQGHGQLAQTIVQGNARGGGGDGIHHQVWRNLDPTLS
jgi:hypothetical protein